MNGSAHFMDGEAAMKRNQQELNELLRVFLDFGEQMLAAGAETKRVEDTLERMGAAYGAVEMHVFVITSSIVITMDFPDGAEITRSRRLRNYPTTDFYRLELLNALSRQCCVNPKSLWELKETVSYLQKERGKRYAVYLGSMLATGSFALFFGGALRDAVCAAGIALCICGLKDGLKKICPNVGIVVCLACTLFPALHGDRIIMSGIMLLIPGLAMINALRDMLAGDTIAGFMRLIETMLWAGSLSCGFMAAIGLWGAWL